MHRSVACVAVIFALALLASPASAALSLGVNPLLVSHKGQIFIPQRETSSGDLGDQFAKKKFVGLQKETIRLKKGQSSTGYVDFGVNFSIDEPMDMDTAKISFVFTDMDFLPQFISGGVLREILTLVYHRPEGEDVTLTLDETNYREFRDSPGTVTNKVTARYTIDLAGDLGLTQEDIDNINAAQGLYLDVSVGSILSRTKRGSGSYANTPEVFTSKLDYQPQNPAPEPATMALLLAGLPLLRRRNRN